MRLKSIIYCASVCLFSSMLWAAGPTTPAADFTISNPSHIPGATLEPGSYKIHIVNRLSDRVILKVDSVNGNMHSTFLGIPNSQIQKPASSGPVKWANPAGGSQYLKGWYFPGSSSVVEFVYPKAEAVAIATANPAKVPAVDPASEGKVTDNTLSQEDMQLLTLWLLSLEQVGPSGTGDAAKSGIKAERYTQVASVQKPVIKALPHTASQVPLVWLVGFCSLIGAALLRWMAAQSRVSDHHQELLLRKIRMRVLAYAERLLWACGFLCVGYCVVLGVQAKETQRLADQTAQPSRARAAPPVTHWAEDVIGRIEIPALALSAPITANYDGGSLHRGVGHIPGTAMPGGLGTMGLAGHRDSFFRPLRRIAVKMEVRLTDKSGTYHYVVDSTEVVSPDKVGVLDIVTRPELTLITCFPFDYVGAAPERFIVHAHLLSASPDGVSAIH